MTTKTKKEVPPGVSLGCQTGKRSGDGSGNGMNGRIIRRSFTFYGWVQGVGFRWRAQNAANALGVTGWVCNNFDGSVSMELQGTEEQIDAVILAVERGTYVRIENMRTCVLPLSEEESGFHVR